ncbi:MAG: TrkH family potassium uptake protein [Planctomycetota bacterium]
MHYRHVLRQLGRLMLVLGVGMAAIAALEWVLWVVLADRGLDEELGLKAMGLASVVGMILGGLLWLAGRGERVELMNRREAMLLVAMSWLVGATVAALPYWFWALAGGANPVALSVDNPADLPPGIPGSTAESMGVPGAADHPFQGFFACYFEAMSGLTTTGATVLSDIPALPNSLLLWRAMTHWLGGLGIVVLFVAVLPTIGVGGKRLFNVEAPGPQQQGVRPRIAETARVLWFIYTGITAAALVCYKLAGMSWFDSVCHAFSVVSTGGLSPKDASLGHYDSVAADAVSMVFMLLAGVNFGLMFALTRGRWRAVVKDEELRVYLTLKVIVIAFVAFNLYGHEITTTAGRVLQADAFQALRFGAFQTISLHTGTGFVTADYDLWPYFSRALLVGLMFIGGCAGSTAGGVKVIRFWIALKVIYASLERAFRPQVIRPLRVGQAVVDDQQQLNATVYLVFFFAVAMVGSLGLAFFETTAGHDIGFLTAATASLSTLGNIGPGFNRIGATQNYGWFSDPSLALMSVLMMLGRLEVYAIAVLLLPRFWRGD